MTPACALAVTLMLACVSEGAPGTAVVDRSCTRQFSKAERRAAVTCAAQKRVPWQFEREGRR